MKLIIQNKELKSLFSDASDLAGKRKDTPILDHALVEVKSGELTLKATDLECQITAFIKNVDCTDDGCFTLPSAKLKNICSTLSDTDVLKFTVEDSAVKLNVNRSKFKMVTLPTEDYPTLVSEEAQHKIAIDSKVLQSLILKVLHTIPSDDVRYFLNGMFVQVVGDKLTVVGTDGHRLSVAHTNLACSYPEVSFILPLKAVGKLLKLVGVYDCQINITFNLNNASFDFGDFVLDTLLIDGQYPDYKRVLPKSNAKIVTADRGVLISALKRVAILANEKFRACTFQIKEGQIELYTRNAESEDANEVIDVEYLNDDLEFSFNIQFMIEALQTIKDDNVVMSFTNNVTPVLMNGVGDNCSLNCIMPVRV